VERVPGSALPFFLSFSTLGPVLGAHSSTQRRTVLQSGACSHPWPPSASTGQNPISRRGSLWERNLGVGSSGLSSGRHAGSRRGNGAAPYGLPRELGATSWPEKGSAGFAHVHSGGRGTRAIWLPRDLRFRPRRPGRGSGTRAECTQPTGEGRIANDRSEGPLRPKGRESIVRGGAASPLESGRRTRAGRAAFLLAGTTVPRREAG